MMRFLSILLAAILAACSNTRPAVERQSFLIQVERTGAQAATVGGSLRIGRVAVAPPFDERALVYRRSDVQYESDFYNQFAADPPDMLAEAEGGWLRQSGLFSRVIPPGGATAADFRLETAVSAFYVDFQSEPAAAVLNIHWQLVREGNGSTVLELDDHRRVEMAERSPAGAVRAYREALRQALGKLEAALATARF